MTTGSGSGRVVIVGGGFAGLFAVRALGRAPVQVTLIDRAEHHLFQPMLYQVATAGLTGSEPLAWEDRPLTLGPLTVTPGTMITATRPR